MFDVGERFDAPRDARFEWAATRGRPSLSSHSAGRIQSHLHAADLEAGSLGKQLLVDGEAPEFPALRILSLDVFGQIGLPMLVGLAATTSILIVIFVRDRVLQGPRRLEAAQTAASCRDGGGDPVSGSSRRSRPACA